MKHLIILFACLACFPIFAQKGENNYPVYFQIKNAGLTVEGHFEKVSQTLRFDPQRLGESYLEGRVAVGSIQTGIGMRDRHLQEEKYFSAEKYPEIVMKSLSLASAGGQAFTGRFELIIKGKRKEINLPFTVSQSEGKQVFKAEFTLNRLDLA